MVIELGRWDRVKLGQSGVEFIDGDRSSKYPKQSEFQSRGVPFLNTTSTATFRLDTSKINFVTPHKFEEITKGRARRNDLLLTTRGSNTGKVALFNCEYDTALINAQMLILRVDIARVDPAFLFYQFRTAEFQQVLKAYSSGSAQPQLPIRSLKDVPVLLPPIHEQRAIANILSSLDEKIELNQKVNEILVEIALTLFKSWFVDFDPVRAKISGGNPGLPPSLVSLFPNSFKELS